LYDLDRRQNFADDPLKTRFQYLGYLSPADRHHWIDAAISALDEQNEEIKNEYANSEALTEFDLHVLQGVLSANMLRKKWLLDARDKV